MREDNNIRLQRSDNLPQREDHSVENFRSDNPVEQRNDHPLTKNSPFPNDSSVNTKYTSTTPNFSTTVNQRQSANYIKSKRRRVNAELTVLIIIALALITGLILLLTEGFNSVTYYNLTFDEKGGSSAGAVLTGSPFYKIDSTHTSSRPGYEFLGWSTSPDAISPDYEIGDIIHFTEEETCLYAVWQIVSFSLSYDANGGTDAPPAQSSDSYLIIDDQPCHIISSEEPSLSDFKFLGWSMNPNDHNASYRANDYIFISADTTLYAVWAMNGDIDKNGVLNGYDLNELEYFLNDGIAFNDEKYKIADFNSDGYVDNEDFKELKAYINLPEPTEEELLPENISQIIDNILSQNP